MKLEEFLNLDPITPLRGLRDELETCLDGSCGEEYERIEELLITLQDSMKAAISLEAFLMAGEDVLMERPSQEPPMNRVDE